MSILLAGWFRQLGPTAAASHQVVRPPPSGAAGSRQMRYSASALESPGLFAEERLMTSRRQRMLEDMQVRPLTPFTQRTYVEAVGRFACYFGRSPDRLGPEEVGV